MLPLIARNRCHALLFLILAASPDLALETGDGTVSEQVERVTGWIEDFLKTGALPRWPSSPILLRCEAAQMSDMRIPEQLVFERSRQCIRGGLVPGRLS